MPQKIDQGERRMKKRLAAILIAIVLATATGCSKQGGDTPQAQLETINSLLAKNYEMTQSQHNEIEQLASQGTALMNQGKQAEASQAFTKAIALLEQIGETSRFNKSE